MNFNFNDQGIFRCGMDWDKKLKLGIQVQLVCQNSAQKLQPFKSLIDILYF